MMRYNPHPPQINPAGIAHGTPDPDPISCKLWGSPGTGGGGAPLGLHCDTSSRGHMPCYAAPGVPHLGPCPHSCSAPGDAPGYHMYVCMWCFETGFPCVSWGAVKWGRAGRTTSASDPQSILDREVVYAQSRNMSAIHHPILTWTAWHRAATPGAYRKEHTDTHTTLHRLGRVPRNSHCCKHLQVYFTWACSRSARRVGAHT